MCGEPGPPRAGSRRRQGWGACTCRRETAPRLQPTCTPGSLQCGGSGAPPIARLVPAPGGPGTPFAERRTAWLRWAAWTAPLLCFSPRRAGSRQGPGEGRAAAVDPAAERCVTRVGGWGGLGGRGAPPLCDSRSALVGRWVGEGRQVNPPGALGSPSADLGARSPQLVCGPPRCARVLSPAPRPLHCVPRLLPLGPHPQGLTASVRRWKNPTSPPPSAVGETEAYRWGPSSWRDSEVTRAPF